MAGKQENFKRKSCSQLTVAAKQHLTVLISGIEMKFIQWQSFHLSDEPHTVHSVLRAKVTNPALLRLLTQAEPLNSECSVIFFVCF